MIAGCLRYKTAVCRHRARALVFIALSVLMLGSAHGQQPMTDPVPSPAIAVPPSGSGSGAVPGGERQMTDIHDIKPVILLGIDPMLFTYILAALAIVSITAYMLVRWQKRRRKDVETPNVAVSPDEAAMAALSDLAAKSGLDSRIFYFALSAILRGYIEARNGINALEMTSEQLLPIIDTLGIDKDRGQQLRDFLRTTDPIKFAGRPAKQGKMDADLEFVRDYVRATTPVFQQAEVSEQA